MRAKDLPLGFRGCVAYGLNREGTGLAIRWREDRRDARAWNRQRVRYQIFVIFLWEMNDTISFFLYVLID